MDGMRKTGQVQTQIFVYILSIIIVGLVLLYGYNAIAGFRERQETVSMIELENQLENTIRATSSDYDSIKKETLPLPAGVKLICFVDNAFLGSEADCELDMDADPKVRGSKAIVDDGIGSGTANIFLVPDGTENYNIGNIELQQSADGCLCIGKTRSEAIFRVRGLGDGVEISIW